MKQFNVIPAEAGIHCYLARRSQGIGMSKQPAVYILSNKRNGTLYIGVTSNLIQRVWQHKNNQARILHEGGHPMLDIYRNYK